MAAEVSPAVQLFHPPRPRHPRLSCFIPGGNRASQRLAWDVIEQRDIAVWAASALLAIGIGWGRYAKAKSRNGLLRQLAAMDPKTREKMLSRYSPKVAMELRHELLERFRIMC